MVNNQIKNIAEKLVEQLNGIGIKCYIWHLATTGSAYIRFDDNRMCSVRIGDHNGRGHLKYKYNLRSDISSKHKRWIKDNNIWRFYLPLNQWKELIPVLILRKEQISSWEGESKYNYTIPSFKKQTV